MSLPVVVVAEVGEVLAARLILQLEEAVPLAAVEVEEAAGQRFLKMAQLIIRIR